MRKFAIKLFIKVSKLIMPLFYNREYLKGRWFEESVKGWRWCWKALFMQKIVGYNRHIPFPVSHRNNVGSSKNLYFDINDLNNFQNFGNYYQNFEGEIHIGSGTYIAPNVGIITQNHDINDLSKHTQPGNVKIGKKCWIGMNSIILPGVTLGDNTVVGAGSVVTKSFSSGNCIIVGNPAKCIKEIKI